MYYNNAMGVVQWVDLSRLEQIIPTPENFFVQNIMLWISMYFWEAFLKSSLIYNQNIPILPEASLTFASKSCGPSHATK